MTKSERAEFMDAAQKIQDHCDRMGFDCHNCLFMAREDIDGSIECGFYGNSPYEWCVPYGDDDDDDDEKED